MDNAMLHIPVQARYQKINGKWVMVSAEYAEIPADTIARMLLRAFGLPAILAEPGTAEGE